MTSSVIEEIARNLIKAMDSNMTEKEILINRGSKTNNYSAKRWR